jgi:PAS domain S-box-containing protein
MAQGFLWSAGVPPDDLPSVLRSLSSRSPHLGSAAESEPGHWGARASALDHDLGWAVLDALPTAVALLSPDGTIAATSLAWQRFALANDGTAAGCGVGTNYLAVCDDALGNGADDASLAARGIRAVLAGNRDLFQLEYDCDSPGRQRRFLLLAAPVAAGPGGAVVAHLDITDRRLAEAALRESEQRFRSTFSRAPVGIVRLDLEGRFIDANSAFCSIVGMEPDALIGLDIGLLWRDTDSAIEGRSANVPWWLSQRDEGVEMSWELQYTRADDEVRIVQVASAVVNDADGRPHSIVATVEDVTERVHLTDELRQSRELEALGRLAGGIAHEINTPTQFISDNLSFLAEAWTAVTRQLDFAHDGHAELITAEEQAELGFYRHEVPEALSQSREGLERVATIVRAMKAFGHPDRAEVEPADLNRIIRNTVTVARNELKYVADVELELDDLPTVVCYPGALGQVVLNLLVNSAHAVGEVVGNSDQRGTIKVRTGSADGMAWFEVSDSGAGIPASAAPHVFEPFFTTKPVGRGTGQGLALAWSVVTERHGGRISFTSEEGGGTVFKVSLPIDGPSAECRLGRAAAGVAR